jgi:hypothetical protein
VYAPIILEQPLGVLQDSIRETLRNDAGRESVWLVILLSPAISSIGRAHRDQESDAFPMGYKTHNHASLRRHLLLAWLPTGDSDVLERFKCCVGEEDVAPTSLIMKTPLFFFQSRAQNGSAGFPEGVKGKRFGFDLLGSPLALPTPLLCFATAMTAIQEVEML